MTDEMTRALDAEPRGLERWPGYDEQSWQQRFAELDRQYQTLTLCAFNAALSLAAERAAAVAQERERCAGDEGKLAYLVKYHEVTQTLIGVMRLHATADQRAKVAMWDEALDDIKVARWRELGVPLGAMGRDKMFVVSDEAVARLAAAIREGAGA